MRPTTSEFTDTIIDNYKNGVPDDPKKVKLISIPDDILAEIERINNKRKKSSQKRGSTRKTKPVPARRK